MESQGIYSLCLTSFPRTIVFETYLIGCISHCWVVSTVWICHNLSVLLLIDTWDITSFWPIYGDLVAKSCPTLATPWTAAHQAPLSMGFPQQEHWTGLPFPPPGDLSAQDSNPGLLHRRWILYWLNHQESPVWPMYIKSYKYFSNFFMGHIPRSGISWVNA